MNIKSQTVFEIFFLWNLFNHAITIQRIKAQDLQNNATLSDSDWNYTDFSAWEKSSPVCTKGVNQSPVDLQPDVKGVHDNRPALEFLNADTLLRNVTIVNNGHTVQLTGVPEGQSPGVTGPCVFSNEKYDFVNAHLHWNTKNNNGTEHAIRGKKYATELHLVHMNRKYGNESEASKHDDGLAVIGILYKVDDKAPPNPGMEYFVSLAENVTKPETTLNVDSFSLASFYSNKISSFYSYKGSLTTPPCTENVRWIVAAKPHLISSKLIKRLRRVKFSSGEHNIRPLQKVNNRLIEYYKK